MFDDYEFYQGVALRQIIVNDERPVILKPFAREGRISAFIINAKVGVFVKHSAKRLSPWRFTFTIEQASDLLDLESKYFDSFVVFVCGADGIVTLDVSSLHQIVSFEGAESAWIGIDRKPRSQYEVWGNRAELSRKMPNGTAPIHSVLGLTTHEVRRA